MSSLFDFKQKSKKESITLKQGEKFRQQQKKITGAQKKKRIGGSGSYFEGFDTSSMLSSLPLNTTPDLISAADSNVIQQIQQLKDLQTQFNDVLKQYNDSLQNLNNATTSYLDTDTTSGYKSSNVFVNALASNPDSVKASYVGSFSASNSGMTQLLSGTDYSNCKTNALQGGYTIFGLQNADPNTANSADCVVSNDLSSATGGTPYKSGCSTGSDGNMYGGQGVNALYSMSTGYVGCYSDTDPSSLLSTGPNMDTYQNVYVISNPPWGSKEFPSNSTAQWVWYTANSETGAPTNTGNPMTIIYNFVNPGSIINITLWGICDDTADIYWNSELQGTITGGWDGAGSPTQMNFQLMPGNNYIQASVTNTGGPAGLLLLAVLQENPNTIVFQTDGSWKFTNVKPMDMVVDGQNYDVNMCKSYASKNNFQYYALQNGMDGSSQCFVTNDLSTAQQGGSMDKSFKMSDGNIYGGQDVMAVYDTGLSANVPYLGKMGYVDGDSALTEYPSSMFNASDPNNPSVTNDASCGSQITPIDSQVWASFTNTGSQMTPTTVCGLSNALSSQEQNTQALQDQLTDLAQQISGVITYLESLNYNMFEQMGIDKKTLEKDFVEYKDIIKKFQIFKKKEIPNVEGILADTDTKVMMENYNYMFWGILAIALVIITINLVKK